MKKSQIYDLTTEAVNKDGINISRDTIVYVCHEVQEARARTGSKLLLFDEMISEAFGPPSLNSSRFQETMKPRRLWDWHREWLK